MHTQRVQGFTLMEMLITVAVIAIISALAFPSYNQYLNRTRRADVKGVLTENAQFMERFMTENRRYDQDLAAVAPVLPLQVAPRLATLTAVMYNISLQAGATATTYTLQAIPANAMALDPCGTFTINNLGQKLNTGMSAGMTTERCWNR